MAVGTTAAILIGAGLATAGTVVGSLVNSKSVSDANQQNIDLAREQMSYQTSEREAVQEYKDPSNQRQLYEQAGFNPYMMMGNINAGDIQAQTGVGLPRVSPNTAIGDMLGDLGNIGNSSINQYADLRIKDEQAEQLGIDNKIKSISLQNEAARQLLELQQKRADIANTNMSASEKEKNISFIDRQIATLEENLKYLGEYNKARNSEQQGKADLAHQQATGQMLENESKKIMNQYLPQIQQATMHKINAEASQAWSQAVLNGEIKHLTNEKAKTEFEMRIINKAFGKQEIKNKDIVLSYLGEQISTAIELQNVQIRQGKQDIENPFRYFGNAILGAGAASLGLKSAPNVVKGFAR